MPPKIERAIIWIWGTLNTFSRSALPQRKRKRKQSNLDVEIETMLSIYDDLLFDILQPITPKDIYKPQQTVCDF